MAITLRQVAAQLKLSPGLVSRVLNNDEGVRVSELTRQRIHAAAQEMQYRPSPSARSLSTGRSRQIAVSGADEGLHNYLSSRLLEQQGLIEAVARQDYRVVLLPSLSERPDSRDFESALYTSGCDGVCLYAAQGSSQVYAALRQLALPFVVLGNPGDLSLPQVDHDNYRYACDAVAWLREQGHTRIGFTDFLPAAEQPFAFDLHRGFSGCNEYALRRFRSGIRSRRAGKSCRASCLYTRSSRSHRVDRAGLARRKHLARGIAGAGTASAGGYYHSGAGLDHRVAISGAGIRLSGA